MNGNQDLNDNLHAIGNHEGDDNSIDSGEGSIIFVNEEDQIEEIVEVDDGVVSDDRNSNDMDTDECISNADDEWTPCNCQVGGTYPITHFSAHGGSVFWSDIHPKIDTYAVTGGEDNRAYLWNLNTGEVFRHYQNHQDSVSQVEFSSDGTYLATGDMNGLIQVWKLFDTEPIWSEKIDELEWLMWHKESNILFAAQVKGDVFMWKIPSSECKVIPGHGKGSESAALMPDGKRIVVGYCDRTVKVFDLKSGNVIVAYKLSNEDFKDPVTDVDVLKDNTNFAACTFSGIIFVGSSWSSKTLFKVDMNNSGESVKFLSHDVSPLIAVGSGNGVAIWDYSKKVQIYDISSVDSVNRMIYDVTRHLIYAGCGNGKVYVINSLTGSVIFNFVGHGESVYHIAVSKDKTRMLVAAEDSSCFVYDLTVLDKRTS